LAGFRDSTWMRLVRRWIVEVGAGPKISEVNRSVEAIRRLNNLELGFTSPAKLVPNHLASALSPP
jgi:hypothetical protein